MKYDPGPYSAIRVPASYCLVCVYKRNCVCMHRQSTRWTHFSPSLSLCILLFEFFCWRVLVLPICFHWIRHCPISSRCKREKGMRRRAKWCSVMCSAWSRVNQKETQMTTRTTTTTNQHYADLTIFTKHMHTILKWIYFYFVRCLTTTAAVVVAANDTSNTISMQSGDKRRTTCHIQTRSYGQVVWLRNELNLL